MEIGRERLEDIAKKLGEAGDKVWAFGTPEGKRISGELHELRKYVADLAVIAESNTLPAEIRNKRGWNQIDYIAEIAAQLADLNTNLEKMRIQNTAAFANSTVASHAFLDEIGLPPGGTLAERVFEFKSRRRENG